MMMSEFTERTGIEPTMEEYHVIEEMYYEFDGDKNAFCKDFLKNNRMVEALRRLNNQTAETFYRANEHRRDAEEKVAELEARVKKLEAQLEKEQEWKPWTNEKAVKQERYDHLRSSGHEMTDDEAKDWIAQEWGFDRAKIRINRRMKTFEVSRHNYLRQNGEIDRSPYYDATDWYYVFFTVCGMEYEAYSGSLTQL
ncbi:MAG: hypothetical protein IKO07_05970 [Clostridia bacterium]|nr:hypothetical protein [Clostridia bacterium]